MTDDIILIVKDTTTNLFGIFSKSMLDAEQV